MEKMYIVARYLHIAAGMMAFFVAPVALIAKKGGRTHLFWGTVFFWAMLLVAFTVLPMALHRPNMFLALVALFSTHLSLSGYRASAARKTIHIYQSRCIDKTIAFSSLSSYLVLIGWGIYTLLYSVNASFGYIAIVFGSIGVSFSVSQLGQLYRPSPDKMDWWYRHMKGMVGTYIGAVSAFSAVNFDFLPVVIRWLWPTLIGTVGLVIWVRYYKRKFQKVSPGLSVRV